MTKHEELVEELDTLMVRELYTSEDPWADLDEEDRATTVGAWEKAIALILSAVRDGLGLPGEEGSSRIWARKIKYIHREGRSEYWLRVDKECYEAQSIIALSGTGKEEGE